MSVIFSSRQDCFCAFCRTERKVYKKRNIHFSDMVGSALGAGAVMMVLWQEFDPRVMLIFIAFLAVAETFVQVRWRMTIACPLCGFDPVLYVKDTTKAVEKVKIRLQKRREDPGTLLARPLQLPKIGRQRADFLEKAESVQAKQKGSLVSRQI